MQDNLVCKNKINCNEEKICLFERSKEIYFHKKTTTQLLGHIGLQNMKVGVQSNSGWLAKIFQICSMDADILS